MKLQEIYLASTGKSEFHSGFMVITLDPNLMDRVMISEDEKAIIDVSFEPDRSMDLYPDPEYYLGLYYHVKEYLEAKKLELLQTYQVELGKIPVSEMYGNSPVPT